MDVLASAAMLEGMDICSAGSGGMAAAATDGNLEHIDMLKAAVDVSMVEKENEEVRQRGSYPQDPDFELTLTTRVPIRGGQANRNHLNEEVNGAASEEPKIQVGHLTEDSVRQVAVELFSDGSGVPAVPPPLPPIIEKVTIDLCMLSLHVSQYVKRVEGKLDGYNSIGYLVAHYLGRELLDWQEALKVGTSARGHALRAKERMDAIRRRLYSSEE